MKKNNPPKVSIGNKPNIAILFTFRPSIDTFGENFLGKKSLRDLPKIRIRFWKVHPQTKGEFSHGDLLDDP